MRIDVECDITKGFAGGDQVWWFGSGSPAPNHEASRRARPLQPLEMRPVALRTDAPTRNFE